MFLKFVKKYLIFYIVLGIFLNGCEFENDNSDSVEIAKNILGTWKCREKEIDGNIEITYNVTIAIKDFDSTRLRIYNFYNVGNNYHVISDVNGYTLTLLSGSFGNGFILESGNGTVSPGFKKIDLVYTIDEGDGIKKNILLHTLNDKIL